MKALALALLLLSLSLTTGLTRADSGSAPISQEVVLDIINLEGTVWSGSDSLGQTCTFRYLKGGILNYTTPSGTFQNGTWKQHGADVYMEMNGKYAEYRGVVEGSQLVGKAGNIKGLHWEWHVQQKRVPGK